MSTYYVDHAGSATDPYDTQAKAITTFAGLLAAKTLAAGDIVYLCDSSGDGTLGETITTTITMNASGSNASGYIKIIGCNASGTVDGTRYVINGNNNNINIITMNSQEYIWFENILVKNTGSTGTLFGVTGSMVGCVWVNCRFTSCKTAGVSYSSSQATFYRCVFDNNTGNGIGTGDSTLGYNRFLFCSFIDNGAAGLAYIQYNVLYGCIFHGNASKGIIYSQGVNTFIHCVFDANAEGYEDYYNSSVPDIFIGSRFTNNTSAAIDTYGENIITGHCYFENNAGDNIQTSTGTLRHYNFSLEGGSSSSNIEDAVSVDDYGYVDSANHDFSTNYDATDPDNIRRRPITIPWS